MEAAPHIFPLGSSKAVLLAEVPLGSALVPRWQGQPEERGGDACADV